MRARLLHNAKKPRDKQRKRTAKHPDASAASKRVEVIHCARPLMVRAL
jgi:hypothetical protein